jgi:hypothetical protein
LKDCDLGQDQGLLVNHGGHLGDEEVQLLDVHHCCRIELRAAHGVDAPDESDTN